MTEWPRSRRPEPDDLPYETPITLAEVEESLLRLADEVAEMVRENKRLAERVSNAEVNWEVHLSKVTLRQERSGGKSSAAYCKALAIEEVDIATGQTGEFLYREWKDAVSLMSAAGRALRGLEKTIDNYRTVSANLRQAT